MRLFVLIGITYAWFCQGSEANQATRFLLTRAIVERHAIDITPDHPHTIDKSWKDGRAYCDKSPFVSLAAIVPFALTRIVSGPLPPRLSDAPPAELRSRLHFVSFTVVGLAGVVAAWLFLQIALLLGLTPGRAEILTVGYALGTNVFAFSTALFGHVPAAALLLGAFYLAVRARLAPAPRELEHPIAFGALLATATLTEYPTGLLAVIVAAYVASWEPSRRRLRALVPRVALGAAGPLAVHALYTSLAFGHPVTVPYRYLASPIFAAHVSQGVLGLGVPTGVALAGALVSPYRGIFFLSPFLALSVWGFGAWLRRGHPRLREGITTLALALASLWVTASYYAWDGDLSIGPRHLVASMAFFALPAGLFAMRGWRETVLMAALVGVSVVLVYTAVAVHLQLPKGDVRLASPIYDHVLPSLLWGEVALPREGLGHVVGMQADAAHNLGQLLGLRGLASLAPIPCLWAVAYAGPWLARPSRVREPA